MTLPRLAERKRLGEPIVMVTAYDFPSAGGRRRRGVDIVLVGDSGAMTVLGYPSTVAVSIDEMLMLTARRAARAAHAAAGRRPAVRLLRGVRRAGGRAPRMRFVKEAGADAVKLERGGTSVGSARRAIVEAGIPVMGHVGLTPQTSTALGGYRAQGRSAEQARAVAARDARAAAGRLLRDRARGVPAAVTEELMTLIEMPVIGIGAGPATDGQVLVFHDLLGICEGTWRALRPSATRTSRRDGRGRRRSTPPTCASVASRRPSTATRSMPSELAEFRAELSALSGQQLRG